MKIEYEVIKKDAFKESHKKLFSSMLKKQGNVQGDLNSKIDRCELICIAKINGQDAAIGAIKQKTESSFTNIKAGIPDLSNDFEWELGYLYTNKDYRGRGLASVIANTLVDKYGEKNLMSSTEISANLKMVKILENNGFRLFGKPWKSEIHENYLGLFLKFK